MESSVGVIRPALQNELTLLQAIDREAHQRYLGTACDHLADDEPFPLDALVRYGEAGRILVAHMDDIPVGFVAWHIESDPTDLGIAQISVLPDYGRRGIGASLMSATVDQARQLGVHRVVLATQIDVAWNAPWYQRLGFAVIPPTGQANWMRRSTAEQETAGLPWANRVWMQLSLD